MAVTVANAAVDNGLTEDKWGKAKVLLKKLTLTGTYATGGFAIAPAAFGLRKIHTLIFQPTGTTAFVYAYDVTTSKVRMFATGTAADAALNEVIDTTSVSTQTVYVLAIGWA